MPSSVIRAFQYAPKTAELDVRFVNGRHYIYYSVPSAVADAMKQALSKGEFFNQYIKDRFRFTREDD